LLSFFIKKLVCMYSLLVHAKRAGLSEGFIAQVTNKRPFPGMSPYVRFESTTVCEGRRACRTWIRFFSSVTSHVTLQSTGMRELLETVGTRVRPLTSMDAHVNVQAAVGTEVFLAVFAFVLLFLSFWKKFVGYVVILRSFFLDIWYGSFNNYTVVIAFHLVTLTSFKRTARLSRPINTRRIFGARGFLRRYVTVCYNFSLSIARRILFA